MRHPNFELAAWFINGVEYANLGQTIDIVVEGDSTSVALLYRHRSRFHQSQPGLPGWDAPQ